MFSGRRNVFAQRRDAAEARAGALRCQKQAQARVFRYLVLSQLVLAEGGHHILYSYHRFITCQPALRRSDVGYIGTLLMRRYIAHEERVI